MEKSNERVIDLAVTFVDLPDGEQTPPLAAYQLDSAGRPVRKLGRSDGQILKLELNEMGSIALGPDVEEFNELPKESLIRYRTDQKLDLWRSQGLVLPRDVWERFRFHFVCVTGTVRKCRPWYWERLDDIQLKPLFELAQVTRIKPITADLESHVLFPRRCQPICDGIVEIYERVCCCRHIPVRTLLERLREVLEVLPLPLPELIPGPVPGPDPAPFSPRVLRTKARAIQQRKTPLDFTAIPSESLYEDYQALRTMPLEEAQVYVTERPYLYPLFCRCSVRKVGQTPIQPGGHFDFCYRRGRTNPHCVRTYAYKVKQFFNGVWTLVYDGLAAHQYFAATATASLRTYSPQARPCTDGPGDPPPSDGLPFVMLEYVGSPGSYHFNFPAQTGVSQVGALGASSGTYTTGYAPDCPWGSGLGLRLWFSPELEPVVAYYRLKIIAVNEDGTTGGTPVVLNSTVTWDKLINVPGDVIPAPETLGPLTVGAELDLFKVPYWSSPDHRYLSGQFHQVWNTASTLFPDGKYALILETFDPAGNRIKPNGASGPGIDQAFEFRRWTSASDTDPVPYADLAHVFWIDNTPVGGDLVDLRKNGIINTAECQFMTASASSTFAIGFRAYHVHGVEHAGNGDNNSFMWHYGITWQRGLNGPTGTLDPAPSGGNNHTDVGEIGGSVSSGSKTFEELLTKTLPDGSTVVLPKCTFSVSLNVYAKHFNGSGRIAYDYHETASFALEIAPLGP